jgi:hypothetical protein
MAGPCWSAGNENLELPYTRAHRARAALRHPYSRRSPGFTAIECATLALGIGATTAMFTIVDSVLLRSLPFPEPERLVMIWERPPQSNHRNVVSMANFVAWQGRNRAFDAIAAYIRAPMNLIGSGDPIQVSGAAVTADFFRVLGVSPLLGRTFLAGEDKTGADPVVVLTHGFCSVTTAAVGTSSDSDSRSTSSTTPSSA